MNAINCFNDQSLLLKRQLIPVLSGYDCKQLPFIFKYFKFVM